MSSPPYKPTTTVCAECGRTYQNLYAHIEACRGKPVIPAEPSEEWLDWWRQEWMGRPNR